MSLSPKNNHQKTQKQGISLRLLLVAPFVVQIFAVVGVTGYLALRNGQQSVSNLASQLTNKASYLVNQHLDSYLNTPLKINQINIDAIDIGLLNLQDFQKSGRYFWKQMQSYKVSAIGYALTNGDFIGANYVKEGSEIVIDEVSSRTNYKDYSYSTDLEGNRVKVINIEDYFPLREPWYYETFQANRPVWTKVYAWNIKQGIFAVSVNQPIYGKKKEIIGVIGTDLLLSSISVFLSQIEISPSAKIFVIERDGLLIASSNKENMFAITNDKSDRLNILQSQDPLVRVVLKRKGCRKISR
jgi:hypothetical protein